MASGGSADDVDKRHRRHYAALDEVGIGMMISLY